MSWQDYVDKQLLASGFVNHAAIIGTDGSLWAKSAAFNVNIDQSYYICRFGLYRNVDKVVLFEISMCRIGIEEGLCRVVFNIR